MSKQDDASLERELDMLMAKAGAKVPADRKAGIVAGYRDLKRWPRCCASPGPRPTSRRTSSA